MQKILLSLLSILFSFSLFANQHQESIAPPVVKLVEKGLKPIRLSELSVNADVIANIATSTYELVFFNPNNRVLEGELVFRLFDGQSVIDYALQINGKYRSASVVPKAQAKEAFEETIRARIDPGLIEKTIGNNFKTRLYPIPAKGYKRIKVTVQEVLQRSNNHQLQYRIPFINKQTLKKFKVLVNLPAVDQKPAVNFPGMTFDSASQGQVIRLDKANVLIDKIITINIKGDNKQRAFIKKTGGADYVFTSIENKKQSAPAKQRALAKRLAIVWNNAFSNQGRDINKEMQFLNSYVQKAGKLTVQLAFLNNHLELRKPFVVCAEKVSCPKGKRFSYLRNLLNNEKYDGTTDFSKLDFSQIQADEVLLFSNGIRTLFDASMPKASIPVTSINSSLNADTNALKGIAQQSKGRFVDLSKMEEYQGFREYLKGVTQLRVLATSPNIKKEDVFAQLENNHINIIAKTQPRFKKGWVQLEISQQQGRQFKKTQKRIMLDQLITVKQNLNSLWAAQKINRLAYNYQHNKAQIIRLAKRHKVLSKDTSLIVLDRVEDYVRYEINPPPELSKQYAQLFKQKRNKKLYEKEQALIESIKLLQQQKIWYAKTFPKTPPPPPPKKVNIEQDRAGANVAMDEAASEPVMAAPMPAPVRRAAPRSPALRKMVAAEKKSKSKIANQPRAEITLKAFNPGAAYIKQIKANHKDKWLEKYYVLKPQYLKQPMFYVDVADLFYRNNMKKEAEKILSNLLEMDFENSEFLRVFALKAMELGEVRLAIKAFQKVKELRPFEPQSFRDLALAYEKNRQYQKAADLLYHILIHTWSNRFAGIKIVVINELNNILSLHPNLNKSRYDARLISPMPVDLRIVINWSSDNTDIDLWVIDPYKEKTFYSNKVSRIGGKISNDITQGYGPEEFMIRDAVPGTYKIQANYYGNSQQKITIPVTIRAEIYSEYSRKDQIQKEIVLRLKNKKAVIDIGEYQFK